MSVFLPSTGQNSDSYSVAEKILLSYTSSSDHNRPTGGNSLTGLPGLVKRPGDDLTEYVLASYRQGQLIDQAVDYQVAEKKHVTLPEFHPMLQYTPHAPFLVQTAQRRKSALRHRKTLSAPGKYWLPDSSQTEKAGRLRNTAGYMRHSLSAREDNGNKCYGTWLGISQLKQPQRTGLIDGNTGISSRKPRQAHSAVEPTVLDSEHGEDNDTQLDNLLTIENFTRNDTYNGEEVLQAGTDPSKGERKTGHVLLAPHSLTAVYVHKYHPVTTDTFLKGNTLPKSPRLPAKKDKLQRKSFPKHDPK